MNIYLISDTHFGHDNMVSWGLRPVDFNEKIWDLFKELPDDAILLHLGDISMGSVALTHMKLQQFRWRKWLVRGNHDNHSISWYVKNGWDFVGDELVINMFGGKFLFSHIPLPKRKGITKNIHGHLHGGKSRGFPDFYDEDYHMEITPEAIGYKLIKLGEEMI